MPQGPPLRQSRYATEMSLTELFSAVFGGWHNFTQGSAGAIAGVLGAYSVAVYTSRNELRREQKRSRQDAAVTAAGEIIREVAGIPQALRDIKRMQPTGGTGLPYRRVQTWNRRREVIERQVAEHGMLLPKNLEATIVELIGLFANVFSVDTDEENDQLIWVDRASDQTIDNVIVRSWEALVSLQNYRRDPLAPQWK